MFKKWHNCIKNEMLVILISLSVKFFDPTSLRCVHRNRRFLENNYFSTMFIPDVPVLVITFYSQYSGPKYVPTFT